MRTVVRALTLVVSMMLALNGARAATLRIALQDDPDTFDPAKSVSFIAINILQSMCDRLVDLDPQGRYVPMLAQSWEWAPDTRSLTMRLRSDAVFQNGEPFDAEAVRWNVLRTKDPSKSRHVPEVKA